MEQSAEVEENYQKSKRPIPSSKSSLIRIDAIYIDLAGAMDNQQDASQCEHFSIRGYAADMRKKDINVCLPFSTNDNQIATEEKKSTLPPIDVVNFKRWSCHNCLREIGAKCCAQEIGKVPDTSPSGFLSKSSCSIKEHLNDAAIKERAPACTESKREEIGNGTEENDNLGQSIVDGSEKNVYHQILPLTKDKINSEPVLIPERRADGSDAVERNISENMDLCEPSFKGHISSNITPLESNRSNFINIGPTGTSDSPKDAIGRNIFGIMDLCEPSFRGHVSSNIRPLESNRSNFIDIGQTGTTNSPKDAMGRKVSGNKALGELSCRGHKSSNISSMDIDRTGTSSSHKDQQRMENGDCEIIPKEGIACIEIKNVTKERTSITHSLDDFSSESSNGFAKDDDCESIRQRPLKVRLLAEILDSGGNEENDQRKTTDSDFDPTSDFCDDMAAQTNPKQHAKGKRKITQFENGKPVLFPQKSQLSKGENTHFAKRNCMVVDSETEESSGTFTKQKNLKRHVSSKKKHKETREEGNYPTLLPRPDVAKKYHLVDTEEGISRPAHGMYRNTEMDPYYTSSKSPLQAEKKSNMNTKIKPAVPVPQWNTMLDESSSVRKDSDTYGRKGVDFSRNDHEATQRNKENHIAKDTTGVEPSYLPWNSTVRERCHQVKDGVFHSGESSNFRKTALDLNSGKGLFCDLNEKIATQSPVRDMQKAIPQFGKGTIQHHRELNMSGTLNSDPRNDDQDKGNEDIPMEIVELMAKNQYERQRHEFERNYFSLERSNEKRKFESMGVTRVHGKGLLRSYQEEDHNMRKPFSKTTMVKSSEHLAPIKVKPVNPLDINETRLNMNKMEGKNSAFVRCNSFSNNQGTQASRVSYPGYGSIGNGNYQNFQWRSDHIGSSFSPLLSNYTNFPQNYAPQTSNFGTNSQIAEASSRGKWAQGLDPNFANEKYSKFEMQNKDLSVESLRKSSDFNFANEKYSNVERQSGDMGVNSLRKSSGLNYVNEKYSNFEKKNWHFGVDSLRKPSAVDPFAPKHREIDLNAKVSGSIDLNSNEAIPAMQLLSLMDAGKNSYSPLNLEGKCKMTSKKPFSSCDYHPKVLDKPMFISDDNPKQPFGRDIGVSSNGSRPSTSKVLNKPSLFISNCDPKELFGRNIGVSINDSRPSSSKVLDKSFFISDHDPKQSFGRDKSCCPPPIPASGSVALSFRSESIFKEGNGVPTRVPSKVEEKKKGPAQNSTRKLQKPVNRTSVSRIIQVSNSVQNGQRRNQHTSGTVSPLQKVSTEFCYVNRNPADFSLPEPENMYTITGRDLKFLKKSSSRGKKRRRDEVPTAPEMK